MREEDRRASREDICRAACLWLVMSLVFVEISTWHLGRCRREPVSCLALSLGCNEIGINRGLFSWDVPHGDHETRSCSSHPSHVAFLGSRRPSCECRSHCGAFACLDSVTNTWLKRHFKLSEFRGLFAVTTRGTRRLHRDHSLFIYSVILIECVYVNMFIWSHDVYCSFHPGEGSSSVALLKGSSLFSPWKLFFLLFLESFSCSDVRGQRSGMSCVYRL